MWKLIVVSIFAAGLGRGGDIPNGTVGFEADSTFQTKKECLDESLRRNTAETTAKAEKDKAAETKSHLAYEALRAKARAAKREPTREEYTALRTELSAVSTSPFNLTFCVDLGSFLK